MMDSSAVGELMLLILLPAAIWALGAAWIMASDAIELRHAQAVRARRRALREAKPVVPAAPSRTQSL
jgi:hypothetical protein